jgi:two-component system LytT family response regulator
MGKINCIIIDNELEIRKRIEKLLNQFECIQIVASEGIPEVAIEKTIELNPDIVFTDIEMPGINGLNIIKAIRERNCHPTFIIITAWKQYAIKAIKHAVFDYLLKPIDIDELAKTLERYKQEHFMGRPSQIMEIPLLQSLTIREKEVLSLAMNGNTSKEIANMLCINKTTVDTHRQKILEKTEMKNISELIIIILDHSR